MSKHFICMLLLFFLINCLIPSCICAIYSTLHKCAQCVLVEVAANSLTSFSSHESVPYRSLQASTSRVSKHLHVDIRKATGPSTHSEDARVPPPSMQRVKPQNRPSCRFLSASKEGNCSETQRRRECKGNDLVFHYSLQLSNK